MKIAFAYTLSIATLITTGGEEIEFNKYCGHVSTIMRLSTNKDEDLLSHFDEMSDSQNGIKGCSLKQIIVDNFEQVADRGKIKGQLPQKLIFGVCKTFKKITIFLGFHLNLKIVHLQALIYTTIGDNITVEPNTLFSNEPVFIPDPGIQTMFNESIKNSFK